jgi:acetylornithine deacetylase/succinyl-diaminopimelate desuccinylase-like protein
LSHASLRRCAAWALMKFWWTPTAAPSALSTAPSPARQFCSTRTATQSALRPARRGHTIPLPRTSRMAIIYGRGAADMKGALAAMIYAASATDRTRLAGRIAVSATVLEEVMEGISLETVIAAVKPDFVVIGEATELNLNRGGRGRAEIHLETIGKPAHSSSPQLGVNAVHEMIKLIAAAEAVSTRQPSFARPGAAGADGHDLRPLSRPLGCPQPLSGDLRPTHAARRDCGECA